MKFSANTLVLDEGYGNGNFDHGNSGNNIRVRTVRITPGDLLLMLLSLFLFCVSAIDTGIFAIIALVVAPSLYAIFSYRIGNHFSFFIPIIAFLISLFATKSGISAGTVILAAGMSFSIIRSVNVCPDRAKSSAVVGCAISGIIYIFALLIAAKIEFGLSAPDVVKKLVEYWETAKAATIENIQSMDFSALGYEAIDIPTLSQELDVMTEVLRVSFPAVLILTFMIVGYVSSSLTVIFAKLLNAEKMFYGVNFAIIPKTATVYVYFICSLLAMFTSAPTAYGFQNITYLISPALMLCGLKQVGDYFAAKGLSKLFVTIIKILVLFIAPFFLGGIGTSILTILGMFYCFKHNSMAQH